jgi:SAM-dependent methyltransferase
VVYAQVRDGVDNAWYLERMAAAGGPVLEIGVGTGRLFVEARRRGIEAWGIDVSPAMIERCRARLEPADRDRVSVADAVHLRADRRFALVCAPFRVLSHVHDTVDQLRLLDAVHDGLEPAGVFVFDLYVPSLKLLLEGMPETTDFDGEHRGDWEFEMRFFFRFEIEHLVARSKLRLEALHGDFAGGPLTAASREYVVVCRRDA